MCCWVRARARVKLRVRVVLRATIDSLDMAQCGNAQSAFHELVPSLERCFVMMENVIGS